MRQQSTICATEYVLDVDALGNLHIKQTSRTQDTSKQPFGYYDALGSYHPYKNNTQWYREEHKEKGHETT